MSTDDRDDELGSVVELGQGPPTPAVAELENRRASHGIPYVDLAKMAKADPGYLRQVLQGTRKGSPTFVGKLTRVLDAYDHEAGGPADNPHDLDLVEIEVASGTADFKVVVKGPVRDREQIAETALRLMADFRASERAAQQESEKPDAKP